MCCISDSEDFVEVIKASLTYGISNKAAIIVYGILYIIVLALMVFGLAVAVFFYKSWIAWLFFGLTFIPIFIMSWLTMGFWIQCLRGLLRGSETMPGLFDDVPGLAIEGVKGFIVSLLVYVPFVGLYLVAIGTMVGGVLVHSAMAGIIFFFIGFLLILLALLLMIPLTYIYLIQIVVYADTNSLGEGLNPFVAIGLIRKNPDGALRAVIYSIALYAVYFVVTMVLSWTCIGYVLLPIVILPIFAAILYIFVRFYRQTTGMQSTGPGTGEGMPEKP